MSHLSTLIHRVNQHIENDSINSAMGEQAVINLMEYIETWDDYTETERDGAIKLFRENYKKLGKCNRYCQSHPERIKKAIEIFEELVK